MQLEPELIRAEAAVRNSEERYRELLASITDYIYSVRLHHGAVIETSHGPGCLAVTGYQPQEYASDPNLWHRMVHPDDRTAVVANAAQMAEGKVPPTIEHRIFHRDGSIRWIRNQRVPHYSAEGTFAGYDGLVSDVTSRKQAEEALTEANVRLREVLASLTKSHEELKSTQMQLIEAEKLQTIGQLAAGVAHEVKNPLAILQMGLGYLGRQPDWTAEPTTMVVKEMRDAVNRADAVVGDLLEFAAPKQPELRDRDLEPLIRRSLTLVRHELNAANVRVATNFAGNLPACRLDANKLKQVFVNIFTNACHAMAEGGILTITTSFSRITESEMNGVARSRSGTRFKPGDAVVLVEIADNGTGIPEDKLSKIFDPYYTTKPTGKGTGLGLTVTKAIIDMHGGCINVRNGVDGGVVVTVILRSRMKDEK
jgi:PAS domain S-box-containing protein